MVGVVCQPDRPSGRGMKLRAPPVKQAAERLGLTVHQPTRVRNGELQRWLEERGVDVALVVAYGRILPLGVLSAPRLGCINLHASLLPRLRGAAPIQWAILRGERESGISLMEMDEGMDTGAVFATRQIPIDEQVTGEILTAQLSELAAQMVPNEFMDVLSGKLTSIAQNAEQATEAPPLRSADFQINWSRNASDIANQVRAFCPTPGAVTYEGTRRLKILEAQTSAEFDAAPGTVRIAKGQAYIRCGVGSLQVFKAQVAGKRAQSISDLINGRSVEDGQRLGPQATGTS